MHQTRGRCGQSIILTLRVSVLRRGAQAWSAYRCAAGFLSGLSRLWVISGGDGRRMWRPMSALPPKADEEQTARFVRFVPCVDGSELARLFFTVAGWSVQPCVRPVCAVT